MSSTERQRQQSAALFVLAAVSLAILTILAVWKLKQFKYRLINETGGALFFGMLLGLLVKYLWFDREERGKTVGSECTCHVINGTPHVIMVNATSLHRTENDSQRCSLVSAFHMGTFDPEVLFDLFLPTVIFYGAYTLNQKRLIQNLGSVLTYAFLGTLISCICIGACIYGVTRLMVLLGHAADGEFFLTDSLLFGAIMSATDPGIVAVLFCGLSQARYTTLNLSDEGRTRTKQLFEVFNFLGEIFIFSYMGYIWFMFPHHVFQALFISGAFLSIFLSRACNIYPLSFLLNLCRTNKISPAFQHFMVFTGLRGVIAFSLAIRDTSTKAKQTILTTTLLLVVFTVWVLGAAADPLLRRLNLSRVEEDEADEDLQDYSSEDVSGGPDATRGLWNRLDHQYLKPLLTHCGPPLADSLPQWCGGFAKVFSSPHLQEDEEQFCEAQLNASTVSLEKTELASIRSDSGSEHQEDLLEGDLGLGTSVSQRSEFPGVSSNADLSSPPPTVHGETVQDI
ncbi:sodium/hydrogen exchanger 9 isoform X1 [Austrofundulus limnaeus]|uniref:Sodium/hydrogen exchanger 9 isoform X1 n=1 Tax=Austrofundulus limnaeus TaxID=52670 RepID=A0A2I4BM79_AUSLI|nr:PREDICTED: sodium/hydrogen exchanger 9 isoform X1 [Austrofundulus limnaeus]